MGWSYELLHPVEQMLLCRLSVFAASFDLEAAESVCSSGDIEPFAEADLVGSLVEKSLVVADASGSDMRYSLLETIRQYGADRLAELGVSEGDRLRAAHAAYYLDWAEQAAPQLAGPSQVGWMMRLEESYPNLRAAVEHALLSPAGAARVLRMFGASRRFWRAPSAHHGEAIDFIEEALAVAAPDLPPATRATARLCQASMFSTRDLNAGRRACVRRLSSLAGPVTSPWKPMRSDTSA